MLKKSLMMMSFMVMSLQNVYSSEEKNELDSENKTQAAVATIIGLQLYQQGNNANDHGMEIATEFSITYDTNAICRISRNGFQKLSGDNIATVRCNKNKEFSTFNASGKNGFTYLSDESPRTNVSTEQPLLTDSPKPKVSIEQPLSTHDYAYSCHLHNASISIERKNQRIKRTVYNRTTHKISWDELDPTLNLSDPAIIARLDNEELDPIFLKNK